MKKAGKPKPGEKEDRDKSCRFLRTLVESLPNPVFYKNVEGIYQFCNEAFLNFLGLRRDQVIGCSVYDIAPRHLAAIYEEADARVMSSHGKQVYEAPVPYADGTMHDVLFSKSTVLDSDGQLMGIVGLLQDVTERNAIEKQLFMLHMVKDRMVEFGHSILTFEDTTDLFKALVGMLTLFFTDCFRTRVLSIDDQEQVKIVVSHGREPDAGLDEVPVPRRTGADLRLEHTVVDPLPNRVWKLRETVLWQDAAEEVDQVRTLERHAGHDEISEAAEDGELRETTSLLLIPVRLDESPRWVITMESATVGRFGRAERRVADFIGQEIPILIRMINLHRENTRYARYDALTGLTNRGYFDAIFEDRLETARRQDSPLQLVMMDLDGLKRINDQYGHHAGDCYIQAFSNQIRSTVRKSDIVGRIGGDEFAGVFSGSDAGEIRRLMTTLQERFAKQDIVCGSVIFRGTVSMGMATFPDDGEDKMALFRVADRRMYEDKALAKEPKNRPV